MEARGRFPLFIAGGLGLGWGLLAVGGDNTDQGDGGCLAVRRGLILHGDGGGVGGVAGGLPELFELSDGPIDPHRIGRDLGKFVAVAHAFPRHRLCQERMLETRAQAEPRVRRPQVTSAARRTATARRRRCKAPYRRLPKKATLRLCKEKNKYTCQS